MLRLPDSNRFRKGSPIAFVCIINLVIISLISHYVEIIQLSNKMALGISAVFLVSFMFAFFTLKRGKDVLIRLSPVAIVILSVVLTIHYLDYLPSLGKEPISIVLLPVLIPLAVIGLMQKKETPTKLQLSPRLLVPILLLAFALRLLTLDSYHFHGDEHETIAAAYSFAQTGDFYKWDWMQNKPGDQTDCITTISDCRYTRAWPYSVSVATSITVFGMNEWSVRLPSVLFGVGALFAAYLVLKKLTDSTAPGIIAALLMGIAPYFIETARFARMYSMLWFVFLMSMYFMVKAYHETTQKRLYYLALGIGLFILSYFVHPVTLVAIPGLVGVFGIFHVVINGISKKTVLPAFSVGLIGLMLLIANQSGFVSLFPPKYITLLTEPNYEYVYHVIRPFHWILVILILGVGLMYMYFQKKIVQVIGIICVGIVGLVFFVFIGGRYMQAHYISLITILFYLLISIVFLYLIQYAKHGLLTLILSIALITATLLNQSNNLYGDERNYGKYSIAYQSIAENYQPGDVIIGQFLRTYYLQDTRLKDAIIIDMGRAKSFSFETFKETIATNPSGFLVWDTIEENANVEREIRRYACVHFTQLHGENCKTDIDDTKVEVFRY